MSIGDSIDCVVEDAVVFEPVSAAKFPANREKNREFCRIAFSAVSQTLNNGARTGLPMRIPYSTQQGIILAEQGSLAKEQGILSAGIEIVAERDFPDGQSGRICVCVVQSLKSLRFFSLDFDFCTRLAYSYQDANLNALAVVHIMNLV